MHKSILLQILFFLFVINSFATHLVGGQMEVKWISGNDFEVTLTVYKNCLPNVLALADSQNICVYDKNTFIPTQISLLRDTFYQLKLGDQCYTPDSTTMCIEAHIYKDTITLSNNPSGYVIAYQNTARNLGTVNINNTGVTGMTFFADFPDPALHNSTPAFDHFPKAYICQGMYSDEYLSATDPDGDILKYYLETPLDGDYSTNACQTYSFVPVTWASNYSLSQILGPGSVLTMSVNNGVMTANPNNLGLYAIAIRIEEWRNGSRIGEIRRDVQYVIKTGCPVTPCTSGIINNDRNDIAILYPNPATSELNFIFSNTGKNTIRVFDAVGKLVKEHTTFSSKVSLATIDLQNGIYFCEIVNNDRLIERKKIILQK